MRHATVDAVELGVAPYEQNS